MTKTVFVLNGPNLNLLGTREPAVYGSATLADVEAACAAKAAALGLALTFRQSNHEGQLIDWLHEAGREGAVGVAFNPGGYTHTSVALHDAVKAIKVPVIEVHISNPAAREPFRHVSFVSSAARGTIAGLGVLGYVLAIEALAALSDRP
ncbi:MAG: type II 3-dehydroquinate dehydratase [Alphaproteobacteria bacterium]|nr:type II 3-dehydroquinate dehydratase [Alphaproteobacteria bacterium]